MRRLKSEKSSSFLPSVAADVGLAPSERGGPRKERRGLFPPNDPCFAPFLPGQFFADALGLTENWQITKRQQEIEAYFSIFHKEFGEFNARTRPPLSPVLPCGRALLPWEVEGRKRRNNYPLLFPSSSSSSSVTHTKRAKQTAVLP